MWLFLKPFIFIDELRSKRARRNAGIKLGEALPKIVEALRRLTTDASDESFATVQFLEKDDRFVQFWLEGGKLHAQATGEVPSKPASSHPHEWTRQLEWLGWKSPTEDTEGNYWRQWSLEETDTLESIGKHILKVFTEVYHAQPDELMEIELTIG